MICSSAFPGGTFLITCTLKWLQLTSDKPFSSMEHREHGWVLHGCTVKKFKFTIMGLGLTQGLHANMMKLQAVLSMQGT